MKKILLISFTLLSAYSCNKLDLIEPAGFETDVEADSIVFAQIGDFGFAGVAELSVSKLVKSWNPDFIISVGDNNYPNGQMSMLKSNITSFYGDYIYNYDAPIPYQCRGKAFDDHTNRFFPTPGNHDAYSWDELTPYYNFFTLPEKETYYKFSWGPATFYSVNSTEDNLEEQKTWLKNELMVSSHPFNIVFVHHPPYSSGPHGSVETTQWDYYTMGVDLIFSGHDHIYERIEKYGEEGMVYVVNGLGGKATGECADKLTPENFNSVCYGSNYGAVKALVTQNKIVVEFYAIHSPNIPIDRFEISKQ